MVLSSVKAFRCANCNKSSKQAFDTHVGSKVTCSKCGTVLLVTDKKLRPTQLLLKLALQLIAIYFITIFILFTIEVSVVNEQLNTILFKLMEYSILSGLVAYYYLKRNKISLLDTRVHE